MEGERLRGDTWNQTGCERGTVDLGLLILVFTFAYFWNFHNSTFFVVVFCSLKRMRAAANKAKSPAPTWSNSRPTSARGAHTQRLPYSLRRSARSKLLPDAPKTWSAFFTQLTFTLQRHRRVRLLASPHEWKPGPQTTLTAGHCSLLRTRGNHTTVSEDYPWWKSTIIVDYI